MRNVSVIVPTYCEAENLSILVPRIHRAMSGTGLRFEIIVVDDNSPDGTPQVCDRLREHYNLRLLVREHERGLSSAVVAGMQAATGDVLLVMDADLSHPPESIPDLVAALDQPDVDFVIGSRYVKGGSTTDDWGFFRRLNSKIATLMARPLTSAKDPMAGFFALRRSTFLLAAETLDPIGYKIGLELIVKCCCRNVVEIPITFTDRLHGESKLSLREQINYVRHLKRLFEFRYRSWAFFGQFALVGLSGMVIDLTVYAMLMGWLSIETARGLAIWIAMTWNFFLNRNFTFSYARRSSLLRQYIGFCGSCLVGAVANWSTSVLLCTLNSFFAENKIWAAIAGVAAGTIFNFMLCRLVVFRDSRPRSPAGKSQTPAASDAVER